MNTKMAPIILLYFSLAAKLAKAYSAEEDLDHANGNKTALDRDSVTKWALSPPYRGTNDILWSCVVTLVACVYTSIHSDIYPKHQSSMRRVLKKCFWTTLALIAPEIILSWALEQFVETAKLQKNLRRIEESGGTVKSTDMPQYKDRSHYAWWVVMGGFVVYTRDIVDDQEEKVMITSAGVKFLAEQGYLLDMPEDRIADRSKMNAFAKTLVCIQVLWMLIQCIARKAAGYPLSLLEIHTMVHIVCALFIYVLWWQKPLDVVEPEVVNDGDFKDMIAFLALEMTGEARQLRFQRGDNKPLPLSPSAAASESYKLQPGEYHPCGLGLIPNAVPKQLSHKTIRRWELAAKAIQRVSPNSQLGRIDDPKGIPQLSKPGLIAEHDLPHWLSMRTFFFTTFLSLVYGGIHLTAWKYCFPSSIEGLLWRISGIGTATSFTIFWGIGILGGAMVKKYASPKSLFRFLKRLSFLALCPVVFAIFCRIFLIVEAFISLRRVPLGVFASVPWVQAIPHV